MKSLVQNGISHVPYDPAILVAPPKKKHNNREFLLFPHDITCQAIDDWKPGVHQLNLVAEKKTVLPGSLTARP